MEETKPSTQLDIGNPLTMSDQQPSVEAPIQQPPQPVEPSMLAQTTPTAEALTPSQLPIPQTTNIPLSPSSLQEQTGGSASEVITPPLPVNPAPSPSPQEQGHTLSRLAKLEIAVGISFLIAAIVGGSLYYYFETAKQLQNPASATIVKEPSLIQEEKVPDLPTVPTPEAPPVISESQTLLEEIQANENDPAITSNADTDQFIQESSSTEPLKK